MMFKEQMKLIALDSVDFDGTNRGRIVFKEFGESSEVSVSQIIFDFMQKVFFECLAGPIVFLSLFKVILIKSFLI